MKRIVLITTGKMEHAGLAISLQAYFEPHCEVEFVSYQGGVLDSFTSTQLNIESPVGRATRVGKIIEALAAEVCPGRRGSPPSLAMVIDDLELENVNRVEVVVETFKRAIAAHLQSLKGGDLARRTAAALRQRASLHLAVPMAEAWFFADAANALPRAGVPTGRLPPQLSSEDPERFLTTHRDYLDSGADDCEAYNALSARRRKSNRPGWIWKPTEVFRNKEKGRHPKAYLQWLCRDPQSRNCTSYKETSGGRRALEALDWASVIGGGQCPFTRAMLADLADVLEIGGGRLANLEPLTSPFEQNSVLRNI